METGYCLGFCERIQTNRARYVLLKVFQERLHSKIIILFVYYDGNRNPYHVARGEEERREKGRGGRRVGQKRKALFPFPVPFRAFLPSPPPPFFAYLAGLKTILVSLPNRTAEKGERQNACV